MSQERTEEEYLVYWEVTVYGCKGVWAESKNEAIQKAQDETIPTREADDWMGSLDIDHVENVRGEFV